MVQLVLSNKILVVDTLQMEELQLVNGQLMKVTVFGMEVLVFNHHLQLAQH